MVTLTGIETALLNVGRAVVTPFVTRWLGGRRQARERTLPLSELLQQKAADEFTRRRGERQIESVVDEVAERLEPLITTRFAALPANEAVAALDAVADTFRRADLSDEALFAADVDPGRLAEHLRAAAPPAALSELAQRLYDLALEDCSRCFTQFVVRTAPFANRASVEMLSRLTDLTGQMSAVLRQLAVAGLAPAEFLPRYAEVLANKLNVLELVGVETQFRPRTTLSVAYVSLSVTGDGTTRERSSMWDPSLLRHARVDAGAARVEQALARRTRTLIRGEAGAGKSTLLRWLAVNAARRGFTGALSEWNGRIPFLIKLRSWPAALPAPEQFLSGVADPIAGTMPPGWVHRQLEEGRGLLLVDGVDELPAERRPRVRAWLKELLDTYPSSLVVVTSRPPAAPVRWLDAEGFESLTLERLTPADVRALIDQWHRAARTSPSLPCPPHELQRYEQSLLTQLAANRHLYRLAGNPLMAAMLCALNLDRETHLPPDRMGIYQAAVDMLLQRRDTERGVSSTMPAMAARERLQLLQDLAWRLSLNGKSELTRPDAEAFLARRLPGMPRVPASAEDVLTHLVERSGILREPAAGRIDFVHRTFQEYLAAREAAEQNMGGMLAGHAHLDTWREIIIMAAGHGNSPMRADLIESLLRRADREPRRRRALVLLAGACLETMPSLDPALLAEIDRRLTRVVPPRSLAEAASLHALGEPVLSRLPGDPSGLTENQAAAVVRTAALVNGPRAMRLIAGYAHDTRLEVQRELLRAWRHFDPAEYARDVLADAPLAKGRITIEEPALLVEARHLRHVSEIFGDFGTKVDLTELPDEPRLTMLALGRDWDGDLGTLQRFTRVEWLELVTPHRQVTAGEIGRLRHLRGLRILYIAPGCGADDDVVAATAALTQVGDVRIRLGDATDIDMLAGMPQLRALYVEDGRVDSFDAFAGLPIGRLGLVDLEEPPRAGTKDLAEVFPRLQWLQLHNVRWPDSLALVGDFADLTTLRIDGLMAARLGTLRSPAGLRTIEIVNFDRLDLAPLSAHPGVTSVDLSRAGTAVDLSTLRRRTGGPLRVVVGPRQRVLGRSGLPPSVKVEKATPLA
ncbi:NACHT domain-containing protein [Actinoplanes sp. CA-142083]|uniref:NACHT domain-containing protein n=1 Tax=Actinoplanes sp. CA-142083 TaxID=3239903 RepID=UPI003D919D00